MYVIFSSIISSLYIVKCKEIRVMKVILKKANSEEEYLQKDVPSLPAEADGQENRLEDDSENEEG